MKLLALVVAAALCGCAVQIRDERVVEVVGLAMFAGVFAGNALEEARNPQPMPSLSIFSAWTKAPSPAPMASDRKISEVDCTQPIDYSAGNIRCK